MKILKSKDIIYYEGWAFKANCSLASQSEDMNLFAKIEGEI